MGHGLSGTSTLAVAEGSGTTHTVDVAKGSNADSCRPDLDDHRCASPQKPTIDSSNAATKSSVRVVARFQRYPVRGSFKAPPNRAEGIHLRRATSQRSACRTVIYLDILKSCTTYHSLVVHAMHNSITLIPTWSLRAESSYQPRGSLLHPPALKPSRPQRYCSSSSGRYMSVTDATLREKFVIRTCIWGAPSRLVGTPSDKRRSPSCRDACKPRLDQE